MENADIQALTEALRHVQNVEYGFVLTAGDPVLYLFKPVQTPRDAWAAVRRAHPKASAAVIGKVEVVRGTLHLVGDPTLSQGSPNLSALKTSLEAVRKVVKAPLLAKARLRMLEDEEDGDDEDVPESTFRLTGDEWITTSGGPGKRSDELRALDEAVAAIANAKGRRDTIRLVQAAKTALATWLSKKSDANPRLVAARRLKEELDEAERLARLQLAKDLFQRDEPGSLPEILAVLANVQGEGGRIGELRDELLARVARRIARYDKEVKDDETATLLFDCAERVRRIGGAAVGNALDAKMPNTLARVERKVERSVVADDLERARTEGEERRKRTERSLNEGQFTVGDELGRGQFGTVHELGGTTGEMRVCAKFVTGKGLDEARHEAEVYEQIRARVGTHPNIGSCFGVRKVRNKDGVESDAIVLEMHTGGSVEKRLAQARAMLDRGQLTPAEYHDFMKGIFRGVVRGLIAMREAGLGHCDIKSDNLMIGEDGEAKLVDMGLATPHGQDSGNAFLGHFKTMASSEERDVFAVGATIFKEILGRQFLYNAPKGEYPMESLKRFASRAGKETVDSLRNPTAFTAFVNAILQPGPQPKLEDLLEHPFLRDAQPRPELLDKIKAEPTADPSDADLDRYEDAEAALWTALQEILREPDTRLGELHALGQRAVALEAAFHREFPFADDSEDRIDDLLRDLKNARKNLPKVAAGFRGIDPGLLVFSEVYAPIVDDLRDPAEGHVLDMRDRLAQPQSAEVTAERARAVLARVAEGLAAPEAEGIEDRVRALADARSLAQAQLAPLTRAPFRGVQGLSRLDDIVLTLRGTVRSLNLLAASLRSDAPPSNKKLKAELANIAKQARGSFGDEEALAGVRNAWVVPVAELAREVGDLVG